MRKLTSIAAAAFAALTITVSGYAQQPDTYYPSIVFIDSNYTDTADTGLYSGADHDALYLENSDIPEGTSTDDQTSDKSYSAQDILKMIGISAVTGLIIALIVCLIMKSRMKTAVPKRTANDYIRKNSFNITRSRDIFIYANVTKKKRQKPENK